MKTNRECNYWKAVIRAPWVVDSTNYGMVNW